MKVSPEVWVSALTSKIPSLQRTSVFTSRTTSAGEAVMAFTPPGMLVHEFTRAKWYVGSIYLNIG